MLIKKEKIEDLEFMENVKRVEKKKLKEALKRKDFIM